MDIKNLVTCKEFFARTLDDYVNVPSSNLFKWFEKVVADCIEQFGVDVVDAMMGAYVYQYRYATAPYRPHDEIIRWVEALNLPEELQRNPDRYSPVSARYGDAAAKLRLLVQHYYTMRLKDQFRERLLDKGLTKTDVNYLFSSVLEDNEAYEITIYDSVEALGAENSNDLREDGEDDEEWGEFLCSVPGGEYAKLPSGKAVGFEVAARWTIL